MRIKHHNIASKKNHVNCTFGGNVNETSNSVPLSNLQEFLNQSYAHIESAQQQLSNDEHAQEIPKDPGNLDEEHQPQNSLAMDWYNDSLTPAQKEQINEGVEAILYEGMLHAASRSFDALVRRGTPTSERKSSGSQFIPTVAKSPFKRPRQADRPPYTNSSMAYRSTPDLDSNLGSQGHFIANHIANHLSQPPPPPPLTVVHPHTAEQSMMQYHTPQSAAFTQIVAFQRQLGETTGQHAHDAAVPECYKPQLASVIPTHHGPNILPHNPSHQSQTFNAYLQNDSHIRPTHKTFGTNHHQTNQQASFAHGSSGSGTAHPSQSGSWTHATTPPKTPSRSSATRLPRGSRHDSRSDSRSDRRIRIHRKRAESVGYESSSTFISYSSNVDSATKKRKSKLKDYRKKKPNKIDALSIEIRNNHQVPTPESTAQLKSTSKASNSRLTSYRTKHKRHDERTYRHASPSQSSSSRSRGRSSSDSFSDDSDRRRRSHRSVRRRSKTPRKSASGSRGTRKRRSSSSCSHSRRSYESSMRSRSSHSSVSSHHHVKPRKHSHHPSKKFASNDASTSTRKHSKRSINSPHISHHSGDKNVESVGFCETRNSLRNSNSNRVDDLEKQLLGERNNKANLGKRLEDDFKYRKEIDKSNSSKRNGASSSRRSYDNMAKLDKYPTSNGLSEQKNSAKDHRTTSNHQKQKKHKRKQAETFSTNKEGTKSFDARCALYKDQAHS